MQKKFVKLCVKTIVFYYMSQEMKTFLSCIYDIHTSYHVSMTETFNLHNFHIGKENNYDIDKQYKKEFTLDKQTISL